MPYSTHDPRLAFRCEQFDDFSSLIRKFTLFFFYEDGSVEMIEESNNKMYLKRTPTQLARSDFYIGASVSIVGKPTTILDYADGVTMQLCAASADNTTILISEVSFSQLGHCIAIIREECGCTIAGISMAWATEDARDKYHLPDVIGSGRVIVVKCVGAGSLEKGKRFESRSQHTLAASTAAEAAEWASLCDDAVHEPVALFGNTNCSVVVIKQHAITAKAEGNIVQRLIDGGLEITGLVQRTLPPRVVDKFFKPYNGVLTDLPQTVESMHGSVWIIQVSSLNDDDDVISIVREICGPFDPAIAKKLRPKTIRAMHGVNRARNAVHCCDLPYEGPIYSDFFFKQHA